MAGSTWGSSVGQREHQRQRTRQTLMSVAYQHFRERGYDGTTVEEIAAAAGTSERTFYRYFPSKDMVLAARATDITDAVLARVSVMPTMRELLQAYIAEFEGAMGTDDFEVVMRLLREHPRVAEQAPAWRQRWADHLAAGLAARAGEDEAPASCRLASLLTITLISFSVDEWLRRTPEVELATAVREVVALGEQVTAGASW